MKKTISFAFLMTFYLVVNAQAPDWSWVLSAGNTSDEFSFTIFTDANGISYVAGQFSSPTVSFGSTVLTNTNTGSSDLFIVKYDSSGNLLWAKSFGGSGNETSFGIYADNHLYLTGSFASDSITLGGITYAKEGGTDLFIIKMDLSGNVLWAQTLGGSGNDQGNAVQTDADGNMYIIGDFMSPGITIGTTTLTNNGMYDVFLVKYNSSGQLCWIKSAGGTASEFFTGIYTDNNGNSIITGRFYSSSVDFGTTTLNSAGAADLYIVKYDSSGNVLWAKSAGGTADDIGSKVSVDAVGNFYLTGYFKSSDITFGSKTLNRKGSCDLFLVKYNSSGNVIWAKSAGGTDMSQSAQGSGITNSYGNTYLTGIYYTSIVFNTFTLSGPGIGDIFIAKYDSSGNVKWAKSAGGTSTEIGTAIATDKDENVYLTGYYKSSPISFDNKIRNNSGGYDIFIGKLNKAGTSSVETASDFENQISIYPNPNNGRFILNSSVDKGKVTIFDLSGKQIYTTAISDNFMEIELPDINSGMYFLQIAEEGNVVQKTYKVIID